MLRRTLIVSAVVASCWVAAPAFATPVGSCDTGVWVDNVGVGVEAGGDGVTACQQSQFTGSNEAMVGVGTNVAANEVQFGVGVGVCTLSGYSCVYAGAGSRTEVSGDDTVFEFTHSSACFDIAMSWYSHCASTYGIGIVDGPLGSTMATWHGLYVCDQTPEWFVCYGHDTAEEPVRDAVQPITLSTSQ